MIYLASASPRRQELLARHDVTFKVVPNLLENEPTFTSGPTLKEQIVACAELKAVVSAKEKDNWVLSADTVVAYQDHILGKPETVDDAVAMLTMLSGKTHTVYTGLCLYNPLTQDTLRHLDAAHVTFNELSEKDIRDYISEKQPYDKAGGYGIQELPSHFVSELDGDIETVIGLSVKSVLKLLRDYAIV